MFIPIVFSINPVVPENWLAGHFLQMLDFAVRNSYPIISQQQYFDFAKDGEKCNATMSGSAEFYTSIDYAQIDFDSISTVAIPKDMEKRYISLFPSATDAFLASLTDDWPEIEEFLCNSIKELIEEANEQVQAIISFDDIQFVRNVAKRLNCEIIYYEFSAIRPPNYCRPFYYVDFQGLFGNSGVTERYKAFLSEKGSSDCPVFSRKELLGLFMMDKDIELLNYGDTDSPYEVGIASKGLTISSTFPYNKVNDAEMANKAIKLFGKEEVLFRPRWPGVYGEVLDAYFGQIDVHSGRLFDFIIKSKRILCAGSNIAFDAALLGRPAYDVGFSHNAIVSNNNLDLLEDRLPTERLLSFMVFATFVPAKLFWAKDYLLYRMSKPSGSELYKYHLSYILEELGLEEGYLILTPEERLKALIQSKGVSYAFFKQKKILPINKETERLHSTWEFDLEDTEASDELINTSSLFNPQSPIQMAVRVPPLCKRIIWHISYRPCVIKKSTIAFFSDNKEVEFLYHPVGVEVEDNIYFTENDPVIIIDNNNTEAFELIVSADLKYLTDDEKAAVPSNCQKDKIEEIEQPKSWRITALLRKLSTLF